MGILLILLVTCMAFMAPPVMARPHGGGGGGGESAVTWNNRGVDLYSAGRYSAAIAAYEKAIKINPRYTDAYSNRGVAYDAMNQPDRAVVDYSHAITLNPSSTASYVNRGLAYTDLAKFNDAISDWNVVLRRSPRNSDAYYRRGFCYQSLGSLEKALTDYEKSCKLNPRLAKAIRSRDTMRKALAIAPTATTHQPAESAFTPLPMEKQPLIAIEQSSKVIQRVERDEDSSSNMVPPTQNMQTQSTAPSPAIHPVTTPRRSASGPAAYCVAVLHHVVGNAFLACHQYDAAANSFSGALNMNPNDQFAYFRRGNAYLQAGRKSLALADYETAVRIDPRFKQAQAKATKLSRETIAR
jgi:tetratricopeptide (TPR) repeat protein